MAETPLMKKSGEPNEEVVKADNQAVSKFDSLKYFLIHELQFCAMFTLEQGWIRSDNIFGSMVMETSAISALGQLYTVISMVDCFCFGYGFATASMMTDNISKGKIKRTKTVGKKISPKTKSLDVLG